jgi:glycosyltransferase involved in cell wall biosynthesis
MHNLRVPAGLEWELLIVNNNCTDNRDAVIANHAENLPIRRLSEARAGKSYAANQALEQARCDLVLWTDDDVPVDGRWLTSAVERASRHPHALASPARSSLGFPCRLTRTAWLHFLLCGPGSVVSTTNLPTHLSPRKMSGGRIRHFGDGRILLIHSTRPWVRDRRK